MTGRIASWIVAHPVLVLGTLALVTLFFALFVPRIGFLTDWEQMLPGDDPVVEQFHAAKDTFGAQNAILVGLAAPPGETLFNLSSLQKLYALTKELERLEEDGYLEDVISPTNLDVVRGTAMALVVEPVLLHPPETEEDVDTFREGILAERQLVGTLVLPDGSAMLIVLEVHPDIVAEQAKVSHLVREVEAITARFQGPWDIYITGDAAMIHHSFYYMQGDLNLLLPVVVLVVALALYGGFRSLRGGILPLLVVMMAVTWTVGLMALFGVQFTIVSTVLPVLLVAVGSAYGIHVVNHYFHYSPKAADQRQVVVQVVQEMLKPVSIAALTTAAGFLTLLSSFLVPVREFGLFSAAGVMFSFLISLTLIPAVLVLLPPPRRRQTGTDQALFDRFARRIVRATAGREWWVVIAALTVLGVFLAAVPSLDVESDAAKYFRADSPVIQGLNFVEERFGGSQFMSVVLDAGRRNAFKDPEILKFAAGLEERLEELDAVGDVFSLVELIKETHYTLRGDDEAFYTIPDSARAVAQIILLYEMGGGGEMLAGTVTRDFSQVQISVRVKSVGTTEFDRIMQLVDDYITQYAPLGVSGYVTGIPAIYVQISRKIVHSQIVSLFAGFAAVGAIVALLMGSLIAGLISLTPLVFAVGSNFGIMAYAGANLDVATVMVASLVIGIGVDYGVHFISRYRRERLGGLDHQGAFLVAFSTTGRGIVYNAITVTLGFLVLLLSNFGALQTFGWVTSLTMVASALGALLVVPAVIGLVQPKFLSRRLVWARKKGRWFPQATWDLADFKETEPTVAQTSSPCKLRSKTGGPTEAFTVSGGVVAGEGFTTPPKRAEHAESGIDT